MTRLDGSAFEAPVAAGAEVSKRMDRWAKPVTGSTRVRLVVQLDPPDSGDAWFLSVLGPGAEGNLLPIEQALTDSKATKPLADELARLERLLSGSTAGGWAAAGHRLLEPSRGVGAHDRQWRRARGRWLRGARAGTLPPQADRPLCACSLSRLATRWWAPTS